MVESLASHEEKVCTSQHHTKDGTRSEHPVEKSYMHVWLSTLTRLGYVTNWNFEKF